MRRSQDRSKTVDHGHVPVRILVRVLDFGAEFFGHDAAFYDFYRNSFRQALMH